MISPRTNDDLYIFLNEFPMPRPKLGFGKDEIKFCPGRESNLAVRENIVVCIISPVENMSSRGPGFGWPSQKIIVIIISEGIFDIKTAIYEIKNTFLEIKIRFLQTNRNL